MPGFNTISPTHVQYKKEYAWNNFLKGGYIAIGWLHVDLTGKSIDEIASIIWQSKIEDKANAIANFTKFLSLKIGDYIAVNNANDGLFGVGIISSDYIFDKFKHDTGAEDKEEFYSNIRKVEWTHTSYIRRKDLVGANETGWAPFGAMGAYWEEAPPYIKRLYNDVISVPSRATFTVPENLKGVIKSIANLKKDQKHNERGHESLVEDFFTFLGYEKHLDIKYQQGRVDIFISSGAIPLAIVEVKKHWNISQYSDFGAIRQAYGYALENGMRYVIVTNGDTYILFDRLKGLSYSSNVIAEFVLTALKEDDLTIIEKLKKDNFGKPNLEELFRYLSESFRTPKL